MKEKEILDLVKMLNSSMSKDDIRGYLFEHGYSEERIGDIMGGIEVGVRL